MPKNALYKKGAHLCSFAPRPTHKVAAVASR